jgi:putative permease
MVKIFNFFFHKENILLIIFSFGLWILIHSSLFLPIIISIVLTYILYNFKNLFIILGFNNRVSFLLSYSVFITIFLLMLIMLLPIFFKQLIWFFNDLPFIMQKIKFLTYKIIEKNSYIFSSDQTNSLFSNTINYFQSISKTLISASLFSITIIIKWTIYIFIIPVLVFFFLKDYIDIIIWFKSIMPRTYFHVIEIWKDTNKQIFNYARGKIIEALIMIFIHYLFFKQYDLLYSELLAFGVGISAIIPYIGTIIISIPVILISAVQFGISNDLLYFNIIYMLIQFIDGNILVPLLFSGVVKLHPVSIIISIVIFGSIFNIYGVFFAIPIAIVFKSIINIYLK